MTEDRPAPASQTSSALVPTVLVRASAPPSDAVVLLAARYLRASGGAMAHLNAMGGALEARLCGLPPEVRLRIERLTRAALEQGYGLAARVPGLPRGAGHGPTALAALAGAAGGMGGLPTALAEVPVTITLILRALQDVARARGFDPETEAIRRETLRVFGSGGPLQRDDGVDTAFLTARLTLTGPAIAGMIGSVAPRLAAHLGPKIVAQGTPVLGALAGAGINAAYMRYYREMAEVRFGLLALAASHDPDKVLAAFRRAVEPARLGPPSDSGTHAP